MKRRSARYRPRRSSPLHKKRRKLSFSRPNFSQLVSWPLTLVLIIAIILFLFSSYFDIKSHTCKYLDDQPCPQIIEAELDRFHHTSIFNFSPAALKQKLLAVDPRSERIDIKITFPHAFSVSFYPQTLLANIKVATNSANLLVSRQKVITGQSTNPQPNLPVIIYPQAINLRIGDLVSDTPLSFTLDLLQALEKSFINISQIYLYSDKLILAQIDRDKQAIFTTHSELSRQVTSLQLILSKATIMKDLPVIDVRFDQPVLRPYR
jgi:hypothetical protein